mmetsp:Transcript_21641/g.32231  ORF Transcript_21641/g.32231 Transcript_21641/m.32231 type:complete len:91 (-) Transcript_21641:646-918(-)
MFPWSASSGDSCGIQEPAASQEASECLAFVAVDDWSDLMSRHSLWLVKKGVGESENIFSVRITLKGRSTHDHLVTKEHLSAGTIFHWLCC